MVKDDAGFNILKDRMWMPIRHWQRHEGALSQPRFKAIHQQTSTCQQIRPEQPVEGIRGKLQPGLARGYTSMLRLN